MQTSTHHKSAQLRRPAEKPKEQPSLKQQDKVKAMDQKGQVQRAFDAFILEQDHPCVMAKAAFSNDQVVIKEFDRMLDASTVTGILAGLKEYLAGYDAASSKFYSFITAFPQEMVRTEEEFEMKLWQLLDTLYKADTEAWDATVSSDPEDDNFSFSLCGTAFYIVGMHPRSSRLARRSPYPAIAFNLHMQFEHLREMGVYEQVRDQIRSRDVVFEGSTNPMLEDFGNASEAKQYSGRSVSEKWKCPFHSK